jgi:hypothetical protein
MFEIMADCVSGAVCVSIGKWTLAWNVWPEKPTS